MDFGNVIKGAVGWFFDRLRALGPALVGRILGTLGIAFASYNVLLPSVVDYIQQYINALPVGMVDMIAALNLDKGLTLIFSAMAYKLGTKVRPIRAGGQDAAP